MGNTVATIVIVSSKRLNSIFNQILVCNLFLQSLYILSSATIEIYKEVKGEIFHRFFSNFLYPFKPMLLHASTLMTVVMARERFLAVRSPLTYRSLTLLEKPWKRAMLFTLGSLILSTLFVLPLLWESEVNPQYFVKQIPINTTHSLVSY